MGQDHTACGALPQAMLTPNATEYASPRPGPPVVSLSSANLVSGPDELCIILPDLYDSSWSFAWYPACGRLPVRWRHAAHIFGRCLDLEISHPSAPLLLDLSIECRRPRKGTQLHYTFGLAATMHAQVDPVSSTVVVLRHMPPKNQLPDGRRFARKGHIPRVMSAAEQISRCLRGLESCCPVCGDASIQLYISHKQRSGRPGGAIAKVFRLTRTNSDAISGQRPYLDTQGVGLQASASKVPSLTRTANVHHRSSPRSKLYHATPEGL